MTTSPHVQVSARDCMDALEEMQTILGGFIGLGVLLREQNDPLGTRQLAQVAMIIDVLTKRFATLLDTALDGMLALGRKSVHRPAATAPHAAEGEDA